MPVLGIPEHHHAAVGMMSLDRSPFDYREAPQRPAVVGNLTVGAKQMSVIVARVQNRKQILPSEELPMPVQLAARESVEVFLSGVGTLDRVGLDFDGDATDAARLGIVSPGIIGAIRIGIAIGDKHLSAHVVGRKEAAEFFPQELRRVGRAQESLLIRALGEMAKINSAIETAQGAGEAAAAAEKLARVGRQLAVIFDASNPVRGWRLDHFGRLAVVIAAEMGDNE